MPFRSWRSRGGRRHQRQEPGFRAPTVAGPDWIDLYLQEDLGEAGDITSQALLPRSAMANGAIILKERAFVAGVAVAAQLFRRLGAKASEAVRDGSWQEADTTVLTVRGPALAILSGERLALNMLARMSGVATKTRHVVERLDGAAPDEGRICQVAATRKTTPGFRHFEKEAVRLAGGEPYRAGLYDAAMVKDNHRAAMGDVGRAVREIRRTWPGKGITVEVESREDALAAAAAGTDWILIDNQAPATGKAWADAVRGAHPDVRIEASGGITPARVADYAWADRVSLGALTQDVRSIDFSLEMTPDG